MRLACSSAKTDAASLSVFSTADILLGTMFIDETKNIGWG